MRMTSARARRLLLGGAVVVVLLVLFSTGAAVLLKNRLVAGANRRLVGYTVEARGLTVYPWNLELLFHDITVRQDAHPEPAVARIPRMDVELQWLALFRGRIVASAHIDSPTLSINVAQLRTEADGPLQFRQRGWQRLPELYPLEVNEFVIRNATLAYTAQDAQRPLELSRGLLEVHNIRHVDRQVSRYPSPVHASAIVFQTGSASFDGAVDLLSFSRPIYQGMVSLSAVPLVTLGPVLRGFPLSIKGGILEARGDIQADTNGTLARLSHVQIADLHADYIASSDPAVIQAGRRAATIARQAAREPKLKLELAELLVNGEFGFQNQTRAPHYRLFLRDATLSAQQVYNHDTQSESNFALSGLLMGEGHAWVHGAFRSGTPQADVALDVRVIDAPLRDLNEMLRAHLRLDVARGNLSVYSQLLVRNGHVAGYVKPIFSDVKIYGPQDADQGLWHQVWEHIADGVRQMLENRRQHDVATVVDLSGPVAGPHTSTLQVLGNALRNAYIQAIVPGFERSIRIRPRDPAADSR